MIKRIGLKKTMSQKVKNANLVKTYIMQIFKKFLFILRFFTLPFQRYIIVLRR